MYTCNTNTGQAEAEPWVWPAIWPRILGKLQAEERPWLKRQGGEYLQHEPRGGPQAPTHGHTC